MGAAITGVWERGRFDGSSGSFDGSDSFALLDAEIAYRLPRRMGTISLQANNLLDESFNFQEIDSFTLPRYIPQRRGAS
jgi:hypothetical protein